MNINRINKTHYGGGAKDVVYAPPLSLIAVCAVHTVIASRLTRHVLDVMRLQLAKDRAIGTIIKVASDNDMRVGKIKLQGVYRLT